VNAYLDTSALAAVALGEDGSDRVVECWATLADGFSSDLGYIELRSALAAARLGGRLAGADPDRVRILADDLWEDLTEVPYDPGIGRVAVRLIAEHGLRALDAIHLATALLVAGDEQLAMVSLDRRLRRAAAAEGLVVLPEAA
jgi:uncharacterized protein